MQFLPSINFSIIHKHTMCDSHDTQRVYDASNGVFIGLESFCAKASIGQARHMLEFTGYGQLVCSELGFTVYSTMDMLYIMHFYPPPPPPPPHTHTHTQLSSVLMPYGLGVNAPADTHLFTTLVTHTIHRRLTQFDTHTHTHTHRHTSHTHTHTHTPTPTHLTHS